MIFCLDLMVEESHQERNWEHILAKEGQVHCGARVGQLTSKRDGKSIGFFKKNAAKIWPQIKYFLFYFYLLKTFFKSIAIYFNIYKENG